MGKNDMILTKIEVFLSRLFLAATMAFDNIFHYEKEWLKPHILNNN